jgi:hypothetical protein
MPNANKDSALHAAAMEEKWGALLGTREKYHPQVRLVSLGNDQYFSRDANI